MVTFLHGAWETTVDLDTEIQHIPSLYHVLSRDYVSSTNIVQIGTSMDNYYAAMVDPRPSAIRQSQQASFNNKENFDVVFMVEDELLHANAGVLSLKSDYFAAMFRSKMRKSIERVVEVPKWSKAAFSQVMEYLCLDNFSVRFVHVVELWELADMYQLEGLNFSCMSALERGLSDENVSQIVKHVENLSCPCDGLKRICCEYIRCEYMR